MKQCEQIDALVTPYVDGEAAASDREIVAKHLDACPPCRRAEASERAASQLVRQRADGLMADAPFALRARCRASAAAGASARRRPARTIMSSWPLAIAATLVLAVAGAIVYGSVINPSVAVAAQLTLDHLKCFALFDQPAELDPADVRTLLRQRYGWEVAIPDRDQAGGLSLVGGRHCVYLDGSVGHLLYKAGVVPVSVFILPPGETLHGRRADIMGYEAVSFARGGRTWVVLARQAPAEVARLAGYFEANAPRAR